MAIDTSAFDRFKAKTTQKTGNLTDINISAFGYQWGDDANKVPLSTPAEIKRPGSVTGSIFAAAPGYIKQSVSDYLEEEKKIRQNLTLGQDFKRTFYEKPASILKFVAQGVGGGLLALGRSTQEAIATPFVGKYRAREATKGGEEAFGINWDKLISGEERVKSYQEIKENVDEYLIASDVATPWEKKYLGGTLAFGLFALDAFPGKPNPKKSATELIENLVKANTKKKAARLLTDAGIEGNIARRVAARIPEANTREAVEQVIKDEFDDGIESIVRGFSARQAVPVNEAGEVVDPETATAALRRDIPTVSRRTAPETEVLRTRVATLLGEAEPERVARLTRAVELDDIDARIRLLADADPAPKTVLEQLRETFALERQLFQEDNPSIKLDTPEGEQAFKEFFEQKFGIPEGNVDNIKYVQSILKARGSVGRAAIRADEAVNQTPIQVGGKTVVTNTDVAPIAKVGDDSVDIDAISQLAKVDQTTLRPVRAIGQKVVKGRNLAKEIEGNIAKYNDKIPDKDIVKIREQNLLKPESIEEIIARKRGIITDAQSVERAKMIQGTLQDVIDLPKGTAVTKEQYQAIEQIVANERDINKALSVLIDNGGKASTKSERDLIAKLGDDASNFAELSDHALLNHALAESTYNLKRAEVVLLGIRAETGRTLQAMNKVVDGVDARLRTLFNKINQNAKYSDLEKQAMIELVTKLDVADNKVFLKTLDDIVKSDFFDKVAEWSVAAKLWNPTTHAVNFGGNTLRAVADMGVKSVTNPMIAKADMMGAAVGFKRGLKNAMKAMTDDGYARNLAKYVETGGTAPAIGGRLGKWVRTPFRMLGASDEIFRNMAYQRKLYRDAYTQVRKEIKEGGLPKAQRDARMNELLNNPTFKMMDDATQEAKRMTFQEDLGPFMRQIDNLRNPQKGKNIGDKAIRTAIRFFVPFLKTPTNLFKQAIDMSPVGLIKNYPQLKAAVKAGDQEKAGTILGEAILGSAIATYIAMETLDGNVTGGAPRDASEKDRFYRENKIPYAIKIGDNWYQYKRVDPFASIMGLTSDMITLEDKDFGSLLGVVAENLKDKTYLSGVSDLMKVLTGDDWERDYALKSMILGAALPSFVGHTTRSLDPNIRVADTLGQRLLVQVPGMSESFPTRVNVLGYDVERANKGLNYFFNPIQMESAEIDPVTKELMDIDKTIAVPATYFTRDKVRYEFTDAEYEDYARYVGTKLRFDLIELFKSPKYQRGSVDDKIKMVDKLRTDIQTEYKDAYIEEKLGGGRKVDNVQRAKNILQGRPADAPALDDSNAIRDYFMNE